MEYIDDDTGFDADTLAELKDYLKYNETYVNPVTSGDYESVFDPNKSDTDGILRSLTDAYKSKNFGSDVSGLSGVFKSLFGDKKGGLDLRKLGVLGGGVAGLLGSTKSSSKPSGFQGSIPQYTATRNMVTAPEAGRRPGAGGTRYGGDVSFTPKGQVPTGGGLASLVGGVPVGTPPGIAPPGIAPPGLPGQPIKTPSYYDSLGAPILRELVDEGSPFYQSPEYKAFQNDPSNMMGTMDMYDSPYFGRVGSGSAGRAMDAAFEQYRKRTSAPGMAVKPGQPTRPSEVLPREPDGSIIEDPEFDLRMMPEPMPKPTRLPEFVPRAPDSGNIEGTYRPFLPEFDPPSGFPNISKDEDFIFPMFNPKPEPTRLPEVAPRAPDINYIVEDNMLFDDFIRDPNRNTLTGVTPKEVNTPPEPRPEPRPELIRELMGASNPRQYAETYAEGGSIERYLQGGTDGMADKIPAKIGKDQPAALSHGEFVIPADVVSHLGNGNSDAGAKKLYSMMDKIRQARTGNKKQGKKINPDKFMPGGLAYAAGGEIKKFAGETPSLVTADKNSSQGITGTESNLSNWAGSYVTDMLGKGQALSEMPYQEYGGPLTSGSSGLQNKVFSGLQNTNFPGNLGQSFSSTGAYQAPAMNMDAYKTQPIGTGNSTRQTFEQYTSSLPAGQKPAVTKDVYDAGLAGSDVYKQAPGATVQPTGIAGSQPNTMVNAQANQPQGIASQYMNPYLQSVLTPQMEELRRQNDITNMKANAGLTSAGAFGGGRQAIMNAENNRNLMQEMNKTVGQGYANAYDKAMQQFNTEQGQGIGLANLMAGQGAIERAIESEGIAADKDAFEAARANPYKMVQFQQSLLSGLPLAAQSYQTSDPSNLTKFAQGSTTLNTLLKNLGLGP